MNGEPNDAQEKLLALLESDLDGFARYDIDQDEWEEDPRELALAVLNRVLSLPVEDRMEAMGMEPATSWGHPLIVHHYDGEWPNHQSHGRPTWAERCDVRTPGRLAVDK